MGTAFHTSLEIYFRMAKEGEESAVESGLEVGMEYLEDFNDGWIKYSATMPTKQKMKDNLAFMYAEYLKQKPYDSSEIIECEDEINEYIRIEWDNESLNMPIKLKGKIDKVWRGNDGRIRITDYKTCYSFSDPEKIDGAKILQAVQYYLLVAHKYKEVPYSITYEEVKYTKNRDGSSQIREYEIVFEENRLYFDFYLRFYEDFCRAMIGEQVYVPNVYSMFDNEVAIVSYIHRLDEPAHSARLMKKYAVNTITDVLKAEMQNTSNMNKLLKVAEKSLVEAKNINYANMETHEKIQVKMLEHGMTIKFDKVIEGHTVNLYCYTPSIGLKMSRIMQYIADIEQVVGVSGVRILAPIPNTSLIGFEVPREVRTFPDAPEITHDFNIPMGVDIYGETVRFDIRKAPHLLVAGATGSGKSVFLNSLITHLSAIPSVDLHLYDPKIVELATFRGVAYEYLTETEDIYIALMDIVSEMDKRYYEFAKVGAKNIEEYGRDMKYKFIIIDEFGDLMLSKTKDKKKNISAEIGEQILRLAQKARACGIHLIIATQRPSTDIITGSIKANFPTKVAFRTAKQVDSYVLLDESGAEKLVGMGDMIFSSDFGKSRLQGFK